MVSLTNYYLVVDWLLGVPRVSRKLRLVNSLQLRASQAADGATNRTGELGKCAERNVGLSLSSKLEGVAGEVVTLEEAGRVEDTAGKITDVNTSEGVGCAGVTMKC